MVIVENGGFGARAAAPIARAVLDYYLLGKLPEGMMTPGADADDEDARATDGARRSSAPRRLGAAPRAGHRRAAVRA